MKTTEQTSRSTFANARMLGEGGFTTPQGNLVQTIYVALAGKLPPEALSLAKASEPRFDLRTAESVRLSRPGVFRETGEVLVKDEQEGRARTSTRETTEGPTGATTQMDRRVRAVNSGLRLCHAKLSVSGTIRAERTQNATSALTFGKDWLIYCTSLWPEAGEEGAWRCTFPENYTSVARIHRPTQFAQALGLGVCEHIGATGKPAPVTGAFHGFKTFEMHRTPQIVLHGPVLYVDDPYRCIAEAKNALARAVFFNQLGELRDRSFENQRYRASGLNLVVAAIVLWNTAYLERVVQALRDAGNADDSLLPHLSPLGWEHINLTGNYSWQQNKQVEQGNFRPLPSLNQP